VPNNTASANGGGIMAKDFDADAWKASHKDDFQSLIAKARKEKRAAPQTESARPSSESSGVADTRLPDG
jgi:hypothetical protein